MARPTPALWPIAGLTFALSLLPFHPAGAQSPGEKIRDFAETASGFTLREGIERGSLQSGRQMTFPLELEANVDYMVVGFCDDDCSDLDLALLDPSGEEVESDYLADAQPVVIHTPGRPGRYQVRVEMVSCSVEPCGYAVGIFDGEPGAGFRAPGGDMEDRLNSFRADLTAQGFTETDMTETGSLEEGQEMRFPMPLMEGTELKLVGVCDNDCEDMDLALYDPFGEEVGADRLPDPVPVVSVTPASTGEHRVAVQMVTCTIEPCGFTIVAFVTGEGIGPGGVLLSGDVVFEVSHQGVLDADDQRLREGEFFDEYTVQAEAGQTIIADLRSPDFDTYLILEAPGGEQERNDDWGDSTMHSHIELVAPVAGTYSIIVTSFIADETGDYTLQLAVVEGS